MPANAHLHRLCTSMPTFWLASMPTFVQQQGGAICQFTDMANRTMRHRRTAFLHLFAVYPCSLASGALYVFHVCKYMLVLPKVMPVNVQKTAETWPFWVKPHSDSHPHAPLLFQRGEFMAVPVWVSSASSRVRTQPSRLEKPVTAYGGGTQRTPGESDSTRGTDRHQAQGGTVPWIDLTIRILAAYPGSGEPLDRRGIQARARPPSPEASQAGQDVGCPCSWGLVSKTGNSRNAAGRSACGGHHQGNSDR